MESINICNIFFIIIDFCTSKYGVFCLAVCTFFFPVILFFKCKNEEWKLQKIKKKSIMQLLASDNFVPIHDESLVQIPKMSVIDYDLINTVFKEKLGISNDFIKDGKPLFNDDNIIISWQRLRRSYEVYNRSLCNGFWSLFFCHAQKEIYSKVGFIQYFETNPKNKSIVLLELLYGDFSIIYKIILKD